MSNPWLLALFASLCGIHTVAANETAPIRLMVQWDNDLLTGSDRDYTNGARIAFVQDLDPDEATHNQLQKALYRLSGAEDDALFGGLRYQSINGNRFAWGVGLTQLMYTPDDPLALLPSEGDRPYAGWLGLETSLHVKNDRSTSSVTLSIGTTGKLSYAEEAQEWVHENISDSSIYQGWESQIPGEMTLNLHLDHKQRYTVLDATQDWWIAMDGYFEWGAALGNFRTDAYIGSLLRAGYNLPASYATPRVQIGSYGHALFKEEATGTTAFSAFGFAGVRGSAVLHDITLDGPVFRDYNSGIDSEPFVGELLLGLGLRWGHCELSFSRTLRSDEFEDQSANQEFGSVMFRFQLPF